MTVKSEKGNIFSILFTYLVVGWMGWMYVFDNKSMYNLVYIGVSIWIIDSIFCTRWYVAIFREFVIDQNGISISLLHWKRFYPWESVSIYYESYRNSLLKTQYLGSVAIVPKKFKKPKHFPVFMYCILCHPCSVAYINFNGEEHYVFAREYAVKKQEFIEKMTAWGIIGPDFFGPQKPFY